MTNTQHAVQKALVHLLAVKPLSVEDIVKKTRIPKDSCVALLKKVGQQDSPNSGWCLANKMFKDLDVWNFNYQKEEDRQKAIDNAVRAYDRLRVEKQNYLWQKLLPVEERGKGKILSRLPTSNEIDKVGTPGAGATPLPSGDDVAGKTLNARAQDYTSDGCHCYRTWGIKIGKLLKDSKKKHAAEEAKEKKRREKEAAASDMEGRVSKPREIPKNQVKRMQAKKPVVKSAEVVHSSEEDEGEIVEHAERPTKDTTGGLQQSNKEAKPKPLATEPRKVNGPSSQSRTKPRSGTLSDSSDTSARSASQAKPKAAAPPKDRFTPSVTKKSEQLSAASAARAKDLPASKETPLQRPVKKVSATASSQQTQLSPKKGNTKPTNPSPLGATRPRNASDVSEKPATGSLTSSKVTKPTAPPATAKIAKAGTANSRPAEASGAQKQPPVSKKRALQDDGGTADPPRKAAKGTPSSIARSAEVPRTNGHTTNTDNQLKRKANDLSACSHSPLPKHRKTDSRASSSLATTTARTSPDNEGWQSEHSSSASSTVQLSWERALDESDKFRNEYYPAYTKLYDRLQGMDPADVTEEDAHKLWRMHHRLQQMKKEIRLAREDE
ncbi:hypothetical protein H2203_001869 [Taxawa tesnikishii (nom. ined.)]|nr:hypothetical protein H2203_001869 [Dothideales sp. JES 119]